MKFGRIGPRGQEVPIVATKEGFFDLSRLVTDIDGAFLASDPVARVTSALRANQLRSIGIGGLRIGAPIARPGNIVCVGLNYRAHAEESGVQPPSHLTVFLKPANTIAGPNDPIRLPPGSEHTDWEVELGVVIGRRTNYLDSPSESREHVAGFVVANDLSERRYQLELSGGQWSKGKAAPDFTPVGPWLTPRDEVEHGSLNIWSRVNGEIRQSSTTADLLFSVEQIVWELSNFMTLEPGDLVLTGTPEGVALSGRFPYLRPGDIVEMGIDGLGSQGAVVVATPPHEGVPNV